MDRVIVFGTIDVGSIPAGRTKLSVLYFKVLFLKYLIQNVDNYVDNVYKGQVIGLSLI